MGGRGIIVVNGSDKNQLETERGGLWAQQAKRYAGGHKSKASRD